MHISHHGFVCPVSFSNEKYIRVWGKRNIRKKFDNFCLGIRDKFANTSHLTNIIPIPFSKF